MNRWRNAFVVDHDASARYGLERLLIAAGYNVHAYASFDEFVNCVKHNISGFIILDIRIPGRSGLDLLSVLEQNNISMPVIVVSEDNEDNRSKAKEINAVVFFSKPVDGTALLDAIEWAPKSDVNGNI